MDIRLEDVEQAYRKLKAYVYNDNTSMFIKKQLSYFENAKNFNKKLKEITDALNNKNLSELKNYFKPLINNISFNILPKKFEDDENGECFMTNNISGKSINISRLTYLFNADVEIHIISVLWIMKVGYIFDDSSDNVSHGYRLDIDNSTDRIREGLQLYKPYYKQYQKWRDTGISTARECLKKENNVAIVTLDLKDFFHSVSLNINRLKEYLNQNDEGIQYNRLTNILLQILKKYSSFFVDQAEDGVILPIGFLPSGLIANWYMKEFDLKIIEKINPEYYGRYVDDILLIISQPDMYKVINDSKIKNTSKSKIFIERYFISNGINILKKMKEDEYRVIGYKNLFIQKDKIKLYYFDINGSKAILDQFEKNIRNSSSEYRFLPEEEDMKKQFEDQAYSVIYKDSVNKLRSIDECRYDKYGASKYLSKEIYSSRLWDNDGDTKIKIAKQVLDFFKGKLSLEFYTLWEKISTYFVVSSLPDEFSVFCNETIDAINKLSINNEVYDQIPLIVKKSKSVITSKIKNCMIEYFKISIAIPLSLNLSFYSQDIKQVLYKISFDINYSTNIRRANLLRHTYVFQPLFNYTTFLLDYSVNLLDRTIEHYTSAKDKNNYTLGFINTRLKKYSPRFVHMHETILFIINKMLIEGNFINYEVTFRNQNINNELFNNYYDIAFDLFYKLNYKYIYSKDKIVHKTFKESIRKLYPVINTKDIDSLNNLNYNEILIEDCGFDPNDGQVGCNVKNSDFKIAVANIKIDVQDAEASIDRAPNLSYTRIQKLFKLLNLVEQEKCNFFVLPEFSIPSVWLPILAKFCHDRQKAIVCGMEHWVSSNNYAFNFIVTILPFKVNGYRSSIIKLRLKNHYAPEEEELIIKKGRSIPKPSPYSYDLFVWKGICFSCFYCYELADIKHRSLFRSKVDFLVVSEYNKDVNYFSNILESASRDIHCYFVQVNSSDLGDSRITKPSKTDEKNILRLKGGDNCTILTSSLDIKALREFQLKNLEDQKKDGRFKLTPPDFDKDEVQKRQCYRNFSIEY